VVKKPGWKRENGRETAENMRFRQKMSCQKADSPQSARSPAKMLLLKRLPI
jgi:hypothetical protein